MLCQAAQLNNILQLRPAHYSAHYFYLLASRYDKINAHMCILWVCAQTNLKCMGVIWQGKNFFSHLIKHACMYCIFISPVAYHFHCLFAILLDKCSNALFDKHSHTIALLILFESENYCNIFYMTLSDFINSP